MTDDTGAEYRRARWGRLPERVPPQEWVEMKAVDRPPDLPPSAGDPDRDWPLPWTIGGIF